MKRFDVSFRWESLHDFFKFLFRDYRWCNSNSWWILKLGFSLQYLPTNERQLIIKVITAWRAQVASLVRQREARRLNGREKYNFLVNRLTELARGTRV